MPTKHTTFGSGSSTRLLSIWSPISRNILTPKLVGEKRELTPPPPAVQGTMKLDMESAQGRGREEKKKTAPWVGPNSGNELGIDCKNLRGAYCVSTARYRGSEMDGKDTRGCGALVARWLGCDAIAFKRRHLGASGTGHGAELFQTERRRRSGYVGIRRHDSPGRHIGGRGARYVLVISVCLGG